MWFVHYSEATYTKYSRLRCLLHVKGLVIVFIQAGLVVFFSSDKI